MSHEEKCTECGNTNGEHLPRCSRFDEARYASDPPTYPEHRKLKTVQASSQAIGEFIEFSGYILAEYVEPWQHLDQDDVAILEESFFEDGFFCWARARRRPLDNIDGRRVLAILGDLAVGNYRAASSLTDRVIYQVQVSDEALAQELIDQVIYRSGYPGTGDEVLHPVHKSIETILAEYFEIDQRKLEEEKRAMLEELRKLAQDRHHPPEEEQPSGE